MDQTVKAAAVWVLACAALLLFPSIGAPWIPEGTPVCTAPNNQQTPVIIPDGAGGAFIAWTDVRSLDFDIYAQRVNERGAPLWATDGVPVCTVTGSQSAPRMVSDGSGGAIITWHDIRDGSGDFDIYAQRLDPNGATMWPDTGVVLCDTIQRSETPVMISDGSGGAIVVWQDRRGDANELYAQRVDPDGTTLWARNGVAFTRPEDYEVSPSITSDGAGGAIVVWLDDRDYQDLYAQRIDADGDTVWTAGGIPICTAPLEQRHPVLTTDGAGGAIIAWQDQRGTGRVDIYAQRVDADGNTMWSADGDTICSTPNLQRSPEIVSDGAGGAIVLWNESSGSISDVHAQRIDASGNPQWTVSGVDVCSEAGSQNAIRAVPDGSGGVIAAWEDKRGGSFSDIYAQRISAAGVPLWTTDGVAVCTAVWDQMYVALTTTGNDETIFVWQDARDNEYDIYGSLADANGQLVPTTLEGHEAKFQDGVIIVTWTLTAAAPGGDTQFAVYRTGPPTGATWTTLDVDIEGHDGVHSFVDATVVPGSSYRYRVDVIGQGTRRTLLETSAIAVPAPALTLYQNAPNPFSRSTAIRFYVPKESAVTLSVYDNAGRLVARPVERETKAAGLHVVEWDGRDGDGRPTASGVYFYRLQSGKFSTARKMLLLR